MGVFVDRCPIRQKPLVISVVKHVPCLCLGLWSPPHLPYPGWSFISGCELCVAELG